MISAGYICPWFTHWDGECPAGRAPCSLARQILIQVDCPHQDPIHTLHNSSSPSQSRSGGYEKEYDRSHQVPSKHVRNLCATPNLKAAAASSLGLPHDDVNNSTSEFQKMPKNKRIRHEKYRLFWDSRNSTATRISLELQSPLHTRRSTQAQAPSWELLQAQPQRSVPDSGPSQPPGTLGFDPLTT